MAAFHFAGDMAGSLAAVAKLGYKGVEFAGFNNVPAKDIRKMLDDNGLKAIGCHTALNTLQGDEFDRTVEFNKTIGNPRLVVPSLAASYTNSRMSGRDFTATPASFVRWKAQPCGIPSSRAPTRTSSCSAISGTWEQPMRIRWL